MLKRLSRKSLLMLLLLLSFVLITACADKNESTNSGEENNKSANQTESADDKVLNVAYNAQPPNFDPHTTTDVSTRDISIHIFESLVTLNGSLEVRPMLADSYDVSDDGKEITFHLREGVQFHNGEEMTSSDVVASLERWHDLSSQAQTYLEGTTYEATDDYTVVAHVADPTTLDLFILSDMTQMAAIMPEEIAKNAGEEVVDEYIGTGPYTFKEWRQDQYVHLEKFADYQSVDEEANGYAGAKEAEIPNIYIHFVKDPSTRIAGLQTEEYHISTSIPQDNADSLESDPNINNDISATSFISMVFNKKTGVFADQKARQAVNAAVNVEDMLVAAYNDEKFFEKDHALALKDQENWYTDVGSDIYNTFDPELAKELLGESGYDGEEVVIITSRERQAEYNMSVVVQQQLEDIGINVNLKESDWTTILERRQDENEYDIFFTAFVFRPMPIQYLFLNSEWLGWTDSKELAEITDKILYADSIEAAQELTDDLHEVYWDYLPIIKPGNSTDITSLRSNIAGYDYVAGPILWNVTMD